MHVNKTLLDLSKLYQTLTLAQTIESREILLDVKEDLVIVLDILRLDSTDIDKKIGEIISIEEQLEYLNKNIYTLENAILCHETKIFEKRNIHGMTNVFCLN